MSFDLVSKNVEYARLKAAQEMEKPNGESDVQIEKIRESYNRKVDEYDETDGVAEKA